MFQCISGQAASLRRTGSPPAASPARPPERLHSRTLQSRVISLNWDRNLATTTSLTIDDFERLPAETVKHRELVDGELVDVSGNNPLHNFLRDYLLILLGVWLSDAQDRAGDCGARIRFSGQRTWP